MATWISRLVPRGSGLRIAVKDLIDLVGEPTTNGSKVIAASARPADRDAVCLAGTRAAEGDGRAVIVGKTNLHELAFGVTGINPWFGTPVNPRDARLIPGGSSSGSAVAVGSGEADIAFGSDTGGSIRIPAACCGVVGLKTTRGRVSLEGVLPLAASLDTVGPMARDVALTIEGMALLEPGFTAGSAVTRIGRVRFPADDYIDEAIDRALREAGFAVEEIALPGWDAATAAAMTILGAEAWHVHESLWQAHAAELSPDVATRLERSSVTSGDEVQSCRAVGRKWDVELAAVFERVDLLALPNLRAEPPDIENADRIFDMRYVSPINLAGLPALAMPLPGGRAVPPSLQLVGPADSEESILGTARLIEAAAGPIWATAG